MSKPTRVGKEQRTRQLVEMLGIQRATAVVLWLRETADIAEQTAVSLRRAIYKVGLSSQLPIAEYHEKGGVFLRDVATQLAIATGALIDREKADEVGAIDDGQTGCTGTSP